MRISYRNVVTNFLVLAFFAVFVSGCAGIYNDLVLDNADHNIPCEELPSVAEVEQNLKEQDAIVQAILAIDPEQTFVDIDTVYWSPITRPHAKIPKTSHVGESR